MAYVLNLAYLLLLLLGSPWIAYAAIRHGKYRAGWSQRLWGQTPPKKSQRACIWLHAVSVGEVNLLASLLRQIDQQLPEYECVISTTTRTGFELATSRYADRLVFYAPLDFTWAVQRALRRLRPAMLVLVELELWPNWLRAAQRMEVPIAIVNGRLSDASWRGYRRWRPLVLRWLKCLDIIAAQNTEYAERFADLGAPLDRIHITGSIKFDGARSDRQNPATVRCRELAGIQPADVVLLAGSTQEPEERLALETFQQLAAEFPRLKLILVPRHPERFGDVAQLCQRSGIAWSRRSELEQADREPTRADRLILIDVVGELGAWWGLADMGFVGGSLTQRGGQNMIEPAAYGVATCFGPHTHNFRDIVDALLQRQAAVVVQDGAGLTRFVRQCLTDTTYRRELGERARELVSQQGGATAKTVDLLKRGLSGTTVRDPQPAMVPGRHTVPPAASPSQRQQPGRPSARS